MRVLNPSCLRYTSDEFSDKYLMSSQKIGPTVATDMRSKAGGLWLCLCLECSSI